MGKIINKICSALLLFTVLCSVAACGESGANSGGLGNLGNLGGGNNASGGDGSVTMREQIYTGGVHVYDYVETDKYVVKNGQSDYKIVISATANDRERLAAKELVLFLKRQRE